MLCVRALLCEKGDSGGGTAGKERTRVNGKRRKDKKEKKRHCHTTKTVFFFLFSLLWFFGRMCGTIGHVFQRKACAWRKTGFRHHVNVDRAWCKNNSTKRSNTACLPKKENHKKKTKTTKRESNQFVGGVTFSSFFLVLFILCVHIRLHTYAHAQSKEPRHKNQQQRHRQNWLGVRRQTK